MRKAILIAIVLAVGLTVLAGCKSGRFGACVSTLNNGINGYSNHHGKCLGGGGGAPAQAPPAPSGGGGECYQGAPAGGGRYYYNHKTSTGWTVNTAPC